ncbi:MAG: isoprenyl transferase [bacterium]
MSDLPADLQDDLQQLHESGKIPRHVAIIMDGNGRWARRNSLELSRGHRQGSRRAREITNFCSSVHGLEILTLYAFSTENWSRPDEEIQTLFELLVEFLEREIVTMVENEIKFNVIGETSLFPAFVRDKLREAINKTASNRKFIINLALNYGGRDELVRAFNKIAAKLKNNQLVAADVDEEVIAAHLDTAGQPSPDLLIRTSGEQRLSNFMLWQLAYSELYFTDTLWPDFDRHEFLKALLDYQTRERRFGSRDSAEEDSR